MITDALLNFCYFVVDKFFLLLPAWDKSFPSAGIAEVSTLLYRADNFAPVTDLSWQLALLVALNTIMLGAKMTFKLVDWILAVIP